MTADIAAVNLDLAGRLDVLDFGREGFTDFVREDEGRLVLHVEIAAQRQRALALHLVDEDRNGKEIVADRELAAGEDGTARNGELAFTALALEDRAGLVGIDGGAAAMRADRLAFRGAPTDHAEGVAGFFLGHARDLRQRKRAGGGREEEVLRHGLRSNVFR